MVRLSLIASVVLVGALLPLQAGMNAIIREQYGHPLYAGAINFVVGLGMIFVVMLVLRPPPVAWGAALATPWWTYFAGFVGASIVIISAIAAPRLGAAFMFACLIGGQLVASVIVDHFGLARYPVRPMNLERGLGVALLIAGVVLIERSSHAASAAGAGSP